MIEMTDAVASLSASEPIRIKPTVVPVVASPDEVQIRAGPWAGPILTLSDESRDGVLAPLIELFDAGATITEAVATVDGVNETDVRAVLSELDGKNLIERTESSQRDRSPLPLRFSRSDLEPLAEASVLAVTDGRIGPTVVEMLADAGVGSIHARHRNAMSTEPDFEAATTVDTWDEDDGSIADLIEQVDLTVTATERPWRAAATRVNELTLTTGTPATYAEVTGYDVVVGPTVLPGETACYECFRHHRNQSVRGADSLADFERAAADSGAAVADRLPFGAIAAGFLVTDAVNLLCYGHGYAVGTVVTYDMSSLSTESNDVLRMPRCSACSDVAESVGRDPLFTVSELADR